MLDYGLAMEATRTPTQRLADALLSPSGDLDSFVTSRREQAPPRSWRLIARDLLEATQGQVDVTAQTLHTWYGDDTAGAA